MVYEQRRYDGLKNQIKDTMLQQLGYVGEGKQLMLVWVPIM